MPHASCPPVRPRPRAAGAGAPVPAASPSGAPADAGPYGRVVAWTGAGLAVGALVLFTVLTVGVVRSGGHDHLDRVLRRDLPTPGGATASLAALAGDLAAPVLVVGVAVLAVAALWRGARRPLLGAGLLAEAVATTALVQLLALALDVRPSPRVLIGLPLFDGSFPSVRTAAAVALWGGLALVGVLLVRRTAARLLCLAAGLVLTTVAAWGQLDRPQAWPTDVLGGWLLGAAAVGVAATLLSTWPALPEPALPGPLPGPLPDRAPAGASPGSGGPAAGTTLGR